jgi:hypothetical protein
MPSGPRRSKNAACGLTAAAEGLDGLEDAEAELQRCPRLRQVPQVSREPRGNRVEADHERALFAAGGLR